MYREIADNMKIKTIPANSFQGITEEYVDMWEVFVTILSELEASTFL